MITCSGVFASMSPALKNPTLNITNLINRCFNKFTHIWHVLLQCLARDFLKSTSLMVAQPRRPNCIDSGHTCPWLATRKNSPRSSFKKFWGKHPAFLPFDVVLLFKQANFEGIADDVDPPSATAKNHTSGTVLRGSNGSVCRECCT
ncbi:protein of unknown function [Citrobacter freundii]|nr:protein of unknown function [Citrobacter freundii]